MIEYKGQINLPNENFGVTEKTITVNEDVRTADIKALAREIHHQNTLIPEDVADAVLQHFCKAAVEKMSEGFAVQLTSGQDIAMRIFPDIHLKGKGNINLKLARELMPDVVTDEATMVAHAAELIDKVGVKVSVRAVAQRKFTDMLEKEEYQLKRTGIVERTAAQQQTDTDEPTGQDGDTTDQGGDNQQGGGSNMEP